MNDNVWSRAAIFALVGAAGLWVLYTLLFGMGYGGMITHSGYYGGNHMYMNAGFGYGMTGGFWILYLIKVLTAIFIVSLIVALLVWVKNTLFTENDIASLKQSFAGGRTPDRSKCVSCGYELNPEWKNCPSCGKVKPQIQE